MSKYPNFRDALLKLAPTNRERAARLGVSERSVINYLQGVYLPPVEKIKLFPVLDDALTLDIRPETRTEKVQLPA